MMGTQKFNAGRGFRLYRNTYFSADYESDIEFLKKRFAEWQKRKAV